MNKNLMVAYIYNPYYREPNEYICERVVIEADPRATFLVLYGYHFFNIARYHRVVIVDFNTHKVLYELSYGKAV